MADQGLVMVFTGNGKGKTTAALGLALRAWGQGMRVLMLQFVKRDGNPGEIKAAAQMDGLDIRPMGAGFVRLGDEAALVKHREAAAGALSEAWASVRSGDYEMVILDEVLYAVKLGLITDADVIGLMEAKPAGLHLVLTGRNTSPAIVAKADLVTEMLEVKHHYQYGVKAQKGIEF
ncbi:MAG: cob(I)yrinic acid a,c-diamide adenosyltransferase [Desulforudis sp.]|nr:MAG: cob(I)yrinic acid a,c-diamide adenosyltransferase [Desulforudis sp.]